MRRRRLRASVVVALALLALPSVGAESRETSPGWPPVPPITQPKRPNQAPAPSTTLPPSTAATTVVTSIDASTATTGAVTTTSSALPTTVVSAVPAGPSTTVTTTGLAKTLAAEPGTQTVMMVVDVSGSMAGTKLEQAKQALTTSVSALATGQPAGLRSYAGDCGNQGLLRAAIGTDNREALRAAIGSLVAGGGTPTPDALLGAADNLTPITGPKAIILISDGQSTCGDPCPTAEGIKNQQGIDFKVHTVGFQAPETAEGELACIARVTGGQYVSATDTEGLADAIGSAIGGTNYEYVAVGDSTTTGFSIPTCSENRATSAFGCIGSPPATPYPQHVAADGGVSVDTLVRKGIWGYTVNEAVVDAARDRNELGSWEPQSTRRQRPRVLSRYPSVRMI